MSSGRRDSMNTKNFLSSGETNLSHDEPRSDIGVSRRGFLVNCAGLVAASSLPMAKLAAETATANLPPPQTQCQNEKKGKTHMDMVPTAKDIRGPSPLVAIENEAPARLIVDPPLPEPLALGRVFIQYRTENLRVVPVFGKGALQVSPRIGHIHITVDDAPWHFVDSSGETIILVGLEPGPHKVLIELADPTHKVITSETVNFTVPDSKTPKSHDH